MARGQAREPRHQGQTGFRPGARAGNKVSQIVKYSIGRTLHALHALDDIPDVARPARLAHERRGRLAGQAAQPLSAMKHHGPRTWRDNAPHCQWPRLDQSLVALAAAGCDGRSSGPIFPIPRPASCPGSPRSLARPRLRSTFRYSYPCTPGHSGLAFSPPRLSTSLPLAHSRPPPSPLT